MIPGFLHDIQLTEYSPFSIKEYPLPISKIEETCKEIRKLIDKGVIQPSKSSFCYPVFSIYKTNGKVRIVVDYKKLNSRTAHLSFSLPKITENSSQLSSYSYFFCIDLNFGYYQLELSKETIPLTSFLLDSRQLEFIRMPFGSKKVPYSFQKAMINLFEELEYLKIYLDDVPIYSKNLELHYAHISEFL